MQSYSAKKKRVLVTGGFLALVVLGSMILPFFVQYRPMEMNLTSRLLPPGSRLPDGTIAWFGTDGLGRSLLPAVIHGARTSLFLGFVTVLIAGVIGVTLGLIAGYYGGWADMSLMRVVDAFLAFPPLLLAIIIAGLLGASVMNLVISLAIVRWALFARLVRGTVLAIKEEEFVEATQAMGASNFIVMFRHILPNTITPIVILATLQIARQILAEGALSFLGMGVPPPTPSWGVLISEGRDYVDVGWWISTIPGLMMTGTILLIGFFGDLLRDYLDPRFTS